MRIFTWWDLNPASADRRRRCGIMECRATHCRSCSWHTMAKIWQNLKQHGQVWMWESLLKPAYNAISPKWTRPQSCPDHQCAYQEIMWIVLFSRDLGSLFYIQICHLLYLWDEHYSQNFINLQYTNCISLLRRAAASASFVQTSSVRLRLPG